VYVVLYRLPIHSETTPFEQPKVIRSGEPGFMTYCVKTRTPPGLQPVVLQL